MDCVDLRQLPGGPYQITLDEAAESDNDPCMLQIECRYAKIYPHGGDLLAVEVDRHPRVASELQQLPGVRVHQGGGEEWTFRFPVDCFDAVAEIVQPRM